MYRIDNVDAVSLLPAPTPQGTPGYFSPGDESTGKLATIVDAEWLNMIQEELVWCATRGGSIGLNKGSRTQVWDAITAEVGTGAFVHIVGDTMSGNLEISTNSWPTLELNRGSGQGSNQLVGLTANSVRWIIALGDNTAESTNNVGSNFTIGRFRDDGSFIDLPISISRQTGNITINPLAVLGNGVNYQGLGGTHAIGYTWNGSALIAYVDGTNIGNVALQSYVNSQVAAEASRAQGAEANLSNAINAETSRAEGVENNIWNTFASYLPLGGGTISGGLQVDQAIAAVGGISATGPVTSGSVNGWQLSPTGEGPFNSTVNVGVNVSGLDVLANRYIAASDGRLKTDMRPITIEEADRFVGLVHGRWYIKGGQWEGGFVAQDVRAQGFDELLVIQDNPEMTAAANGWSGPPGKQFYLKDGALALIATSVRGIQDRIRELAGRLETLEARAARA
jgi:hypothetical protein